MSKKIIAILAALTLSIGAVGCTKSVNNNETAVIDTIGEADTTITLGSTVTVEGEGVILEDNKVIIKSSGTYAVTGTLEDGQLVVDAGDEDNVEIILNGANITSSNSAAINIINCKNSYISLQEGTENIVTDGKEYVLEEGVDEPNAAIFSKDDLSISGTGSLVVNANYNDGIASKDDLEILSGNITVNSVGDGIRGKDSVTVGNGNLEITSGKDGIKSTNVEEAEKGYVLIEGGSLNINSTEDGIQAETALTINGGEFNIISGGGSENAEEKSDKEFERFGMSENTTDEETEGDISTKGIKAGTAIKIDNGNFNINSADDAIHSNGTLEINGGTFEIATGDDGAHAETQLDINDGTINITKSYEGLEGLVININGGDINLVASDDGINAASATSSEMGMMGPNSGGDSSVSLNINGGKVVVDARGDGLDSNGSINMTAGTVIVNGPEDNGNGALDYDGSFNISGGLLIAAGSSGMTQSVSTTSTQNSISLFLDSTKEANTLVSIKDESGNEIVTFAPSKTFQSVVISSPEIITGTKYTASVGGTSTGTVINGLYTDGTYSGGAEAGNATVESAVTTIGTATNGMGGQGGMMKPGGGQGGQKPENMGTPPQGDQGMVRP